LSHSVEFQNIFFKINFFSVGTAGIILQAPTLYDTRPAIDEQLSEIEAAHISKPEAPPIDYPTVASF
jgi:hypothetical protein